MDEGISVNLGSGGEEEGRSLRPGKSKGVVSAERSNLQGLDGQLKVVEGTRRRGEVEDEIDLPGKVDEARHIVLDETEIRISLVVGDVVQRTGEKIVDRHDLMPFGQKTVAEMGAEESGPPRDEGDRLAGRIRD